MLNRLRIYHFLPYPLRVLAASIQGCYLHRWRYGPETEQLIEEALERERWSPQQWNRWQQEKLARLLHRAATKVPYYREYWAKRRRHGDQTSWKALKNWPIIRKETLRETPRAFIAEDCNSRHMFCNRTSGTTGTPLSIYAKRDTIRDWYALSETRLQRWHGVSSKDRWAILGGQLIVPFHRKKPPFWVFNAGLNQLYLSTHHISAENAKWYVKALHRYAPNHMLVYPSSAFVLAITILTHQLTPPSLKVIFSNAELLLDSHRRTISEVFGCPAINTYGMGEMAAAASECEKGLMHIWPEAGIIEVFDDTKDIPAKNAETGRFIVTGLLNADMPLIRYEVGDRGRLETSAARCTCNRTLPLLANIEGRLQDLIITPDGRRIFWLNPVFYGLPIQEAQIIQESIKQIRVRFIPANEYVDHHGLTIVQRLKDRIGDMEVVLEPVGCIPRSASGKFRPVVSNLPGIQ